MTEAEWTACNDPTPMLEFLRGKASDRKLRLFACACCRVGWHVVKNERSRRAVMTAERYADGLAARKVLNEVWAAASQVGWRGTPTRAAGAAASGAAQAAAPTMTTLEAASVATAITHAMRSPKNLSGLIRDIFGNPFRPLPPLDPAWLGWNDSAIRKIAQTIYDTRAFDRLPVLADALEDAGCTDAAILAHCRERGEHVRGCWVVDLLLGKS